MIRTLRDNIAHIGHFHTAGYPGRNEPDENPELYNQAICRSLAAMDYDRYIGQEFTPKGEPVAALQQAVDACNV